MESNKLAIIKSTIPIKAIPESDLNKSIIMYSVFVADLLSLTDEVSAKRLEIALPALKNHCWSMGFAEITKMFEMYVDNKLSLKPIPNYFDRILLGKIVTAYRDQKPRKKETIKPIEMTDDAKQKLIIEGVTRCFEQYKQTGEIIAGYLWVYNHFFELGVLPDHTPEFKKEIGKRALAALKREHSQDKNKSNSMKAFLNNIERGGKLANMAKKLILGGYFEELEESGTSLAEVLRKSLRSH